MDDTTPRNGLPATLPAPAEETAAPLRVPREGMDAAMRAMGVPGGLAGLPTFFAMLAGEEKTPEGIDPLTKALEDPSTTLALAFQARAADGTPRATFVIAIAPTPEEPGQ